jgi:hypothetical protein
MTYRLTKEEQETVIRCSAADQEWDVCTVDPRFIRHLNRQGYHPEPDYQFPDHMSCKVLFRKLRIRRISELKADQKARLAFRLKTRPRNRESAEAKS